MWTHQIVGLSAIQSSVISAGIFAGFGFGPMTTKILLKTFDYNYGNDVYTVCLLHRANYYLRCVVLSEQKATKLRSYLQSLIFDDY